MFLGCCVSSGQAQNVHFRSLTLDVTEEAWMELANRRQWQPDDLTALRIINRLTNTSDAVLEAHASQVKSSNFEIAQDPTRFAGTVSRLQGRATQYDPVPLPLELVNQFNFESYYLVEVAMDDSSQTAVVAVPTIPKSWERLDRLSEPITCLACFLMTGIKDGQPRGVWAAPRVRWMPESEHPAAGVGRDQVLLARHGLDLGLLDSARHNSARAFLREEQKLFVEFMQAVTNIDDAVAAGRTSLPAVAPPWDLVQSIREPTSMAGTLVPVAGTVRRITPVKIQSAEIRERLGLEQYYQLDVFLSLGNRRLRFVDEDDREVVIQGRYGVTVILSQLPAALRETVRQIPQIELPCFYLKQWRHVTPASQEVSEDIRKPNPILVGLPSQLKVLQGTARVSINSFATAFFACFLLVLAGLVWWNVSRGRRRSETSQTDEADAIRGLRDLAD